MNNKKKGGGGGRKAKKQEEYGDGDAESHGSPPFSDAHGPGGGDDDDAGDASFHENLINDNSQDFGEAGSEHLNLDDDVPYGGRPGASTPPAQDKVLKKHKSHKSHRHHRDRGDKKDKKKSKYDNADDEEIGHKRRRRQK